MSQLDNNLANLAVRAICEPGIWEQILQHIIASTPAKAATITLRDKTTCQVVNDDALETSYYSPLMQGFSHESLVYYLKELRENDPWAEAQRIHYPHHPTIMTRVCLPDKIADRKFFDWLANEDLCDTVVFELERMSGHWTALNLFFGAGKVEISDTLLNFCNTHYDLLRHAWQSSQHVLRNTQAGKAALDHLSNRAIPACVISPNGKVTQSNLAFQKLLSRNAVKISAPSARLSVSRNAEFIGDDGFERTKVLMHENSDIPCKILVSAYDTDPLYKGKKQKFWLLCFEMRNKIGEVGLDQVFNLSQLSSQEKKMFEAISKGLSIIEAGAKIRVKRARAHTIWSEVRRKLNIENAHELRGMTKTVSIDHFQKPTNLAS